MATPYQRGAALERWIVDALREHGWYALRSAGSKGEADVVAARDLSPLGPPRPTLLLIQAKSGASALPGVAEWNALVEAARRAGATPLLVHRVGKGKRTVDWWEITGPKTKPGQHRKNWPWRKWSLDPGREPEKYQGS